MKEGEKEQKGSQGRVTPGGSGDQSHQVPVTGGGHATVASGVLDKSFPGGVKSKSLTELETEPEGPGRHTTHGALLRQEAGGGGGCREGHLV